MKPLKPATRILLALAALAMISGYFLPMWEIQLWAPQYPEGLNMKIWLNRLSGDFDIINGLNHYIGMRHIKQEMFPEFGYMRYALGFLIAAGLLPAVTGRRSLHIVFVTILFLGAGLGLYDFWSWGYDYGHNLDPKAAISVPGMSYNPPLFGYKSLLNFVAYSGPDTGGWVLIGSGALATALLVWESPPFVRKSCPGAGAGLPILAAAVFFLPGCTAEPEPISYGRDECAGCKMILADKHYGNEFITAKGKVFKFDDLCCLAEFIGNQSGRALVIDFESPGSFIDAGKAVFLKHDKLRSPMGSHIAAFVSENAATAARDQLGGGGAILTWSDVLKEP